MQQLEIIQGDVLEKLRLLPSDSIHAVVTSVPYWGLRSYLPDDHPDKPKEIGSEPTPEAWAAKLVEVFREVKRVLHPSGTVWLNCGDSYAAGKAKTYNSNGYKDPGWTNEQSRKPPPDYKCKDLVGAPWLLAFALRADNWWLRQEIIWHKPNAMPESCYDRCTKVHESIFLLTKNEHYFFDNEAIKEPVTGDAHPRCEGKNSRMSVERQPGKEDSKPNPSRYSRRPGVTPKSAERSSGVKANSDFHANVNGLVGSRNKRSVWTIATDPYPEAHFATFPSDLVKPCVLAGTSARGVCPRCLAPWERIVVNGEPNMEWRKQSGADLAGGYSGQSTKRHDDHGIQNASDVKRRILEGMVEKKTIGWEPTCRCGSCNQCGEDSKHGLCEGAAIKPFDPIPATCLDIFFGSGTVGEVALELGRNCIGIELSEEYVQLARERCAKVTPGFALA